jgi:hypothetical protein
MPLNYDDYRRLTAYLQGRLQELDPEMYELVNRHVEPTQDLHRYLLDFLEALMKVASERSAGSHGEVLNVLNSVIRTDEGAPVRGVRVMMSPEHQEIYQTESVDLVQLPDRSSFVADLRELHQAISEEPDPWRERDNDR